MAEPIHCCYCAIDENVAFEANWKENEKSFRDEMGLKSLGESDS
jgi:hypothetical protein